MQNPFEAREIWFLTGSQGLYGPETLDQVAEHLDKFDRLPAEVRAQFDALKQELGA